MRLHGTIEPMKKPDPTAEALGALAGAQEQSPDARRALLRKHLANRSNWVVAKAAKIAGEVRDEELAPDLVAAFHRLMADPVKHDKGCTALTEIAAALYSIDHYDPELLLAGIRHVQMEGSFGTPADAAVQLRSHCAMGLAQTRHPDAPYELVKLLADPEPGARAGAARAIATLPGDAGALLLRFKALIGDRVSDVLAECFAGLLAAEPERSLEFVAGFVDGDDEEVAEAAILAIGESRMPQGVEWLKQRWERTVHGPIRKTLLLALATARIEPAIEFLLKLLNEENPRSAVEVMSALRIYKHDERVRRAVGDIVDRRKDPTILQAFRGAF
jgi:HEAT repeat protein